MSAACLQTQRQRQKQTQRQIQQPVYIIEQILSIDHLKKACKHPVLDIDRSSQYSYTNCQCHKFLWFLKARNEAFDFLSSSKDF